MVRAIEIGPNLMDEIDCHPGLNDDTRLVFSLRQIVPATEIADLLGKSAQSITDLQWRGLRALADRTEVAGLDLPVPVLPFREVEALALVGVEKQAKIAILEKGWKEIKFQPKERLVLLARFNNGLTMEQTGRQLNLTMGQVNRAQQNGLAKLRFYFVGKGFPLTEV